MLLSSMAQSQNGGFGSLSNDRNEPLHFNSDSLIFNQAKNIAELFDGVKITQGKSTLNAEYVKLIYSETNNNLEKILAERNVELKSNTDIAKADKAVYSLIENSISLTGNAQLVQGSNKILADQILIDTKTGLTQLLGGCLLYTSPSPRDKRQSRMPSSA